MIDCDAYLPKKDTINIYFLKQVTTNAKDVRLSSPFNPIVYQEKLSEGGSCALD